MHHKEAHCRAAGVDEEEVRLYVDGQLVRSSMDALGVLLGNREDRIDIQYEVSSSPEVELNTGSWTGIARNRSGMGLYRRKQEVRRLAWPKLHTR